MCLLCLGQVLVASLDVPILATPLDVEAIQLHIFKRKREPSFSNRKIIQFVIYNNVRWTSEEETTDAALYWCTGIGESSTSRAKWIEKKTT